MVLIQDYATLYEEHADHIVTRFEHYIFGGHISPSDTDTLKAVEDFVAFCVEQDKKDIDEPRGQDGSTWRQRRNERLTDESRNIEAGA